jgi:hypothetical protein
MAMNKRQASRYSRLFTVLVLLLLAPLPARAENFIQLPLGQMITLSDHIVIGTVANVFPIGEPGQHLAEIAVNEDLLGNGPPPLITLEGNSLDPDLPSFVEGNQVLAFVREFGVDEFQPVEKSQGIVVIPAGSLDVTRAIVQKAIDLGPALGLADVNEEIKSLGPEPSAQLIGSLLGELQLNLAAADAPLLLEVGCDPAGLYIDEARLWGIYRLGDLDIAEARTCMEAIVASDIELRARVAAAEALGEIGDPESRKVLESVLKSKPGKKNSNLDDSERALRLSIILALGKIGDQKASKMLQDLALTGEDLEIQSTAVHSLGLIGGKKGSQAILKINKKHPNAYIRDLAGRTLETLQAEPPASPD